MSATLIQQESEAFYTLITEKGKEIGVCFHSWGRVGVYIRRNGAIGFSAGRRFATIAEAIDSYRTTDVKSALSALAAAQGLHMP